MPRKVDWWGLSFGQSFGSWEEFGQRLQLNLLTSYSTMTSNSCPTMLTIMIFEIYPHEGTMATQNLGFLLWSILQSFSRTLPTTPAMVLPCVDKIQIGGSLDISSKGLLDQRIDKVWKLGSTFRRGLCLPKGDIESRLALVAPTQLCWVWENRILYLHHDGGKQL